MMDRWQLIKWIYSNIDYYEKILHSASICFKMIGLYEDFKLLCNGSNNSLKINFSFDGNHCVKSVQLRSFFWSVFSRIWTECGKIRTRKNYIFGGFSRSDQEQCNTISQT